jgi:membrane protease YdiL (CAAX protease family)
MTTPTRHGGDAGDAPDNQEEAGTAFASDAPPPLLASPASAPSRGDTERPSVLSGWPAVAIITVFIGGGMSLAFNADRAGTAAFWAYAIAPSVLVAAFALARAARDGELFHLVRPAWGDATIAIMSAAVLFGGTFFAVRRALPLASPRAAWLARLYLQIGDPALLRAHVGGVVTMVLVAAAAEEIVWRGLVTRLIAEKIGSRWAWAWAAVPYALAEAPTVQALRDPVAGPNPLLVIAALVLGLAWGWIARSQRRLAPAILSHAAFLWCVVMVFRLW